MDSPLALQVIATGLLTVSGAGAPKPLDPTFSGRGISAVTRITAGAPVGSIAYVLTLDEGLPGNSGEVVAEGQAYPLAQVPGAGLGATSLTNVPTPDIRCVCTIRGSTTNTLALNGTTITSISVNYINTPVLSPSADGGFTQIQLVFQDAAGAAVDPTDAICAGIELIVFKAQGQVD